MFGEEFQEQLDPSILLVVEPDYLPDSEVFCFQLCLYPMKYLHPRSMYTLPHRGVQRGVTLRGLQGAKPHCLVNVYCNFIVNMDHSL
jgi:hypothetical protein